MEIAIGAAVTLIVAEQQRKSASKRAARDRRAAAARAESLDKETALPLDQSSEAALQSRKRRRAAVGFKDQSPKLGTPGLFRTGVG